MKAVLFVAFGGALGALARWSIHRWVDSFRGDSGFPWGIFVTNVLGCLAIGWLFAAVVEKKMLSQDLVLGILTGFLGSMTTFSTFGWNSFELFRSGQAGLALANVGGSVVVGLLAVWGGYVLGKI